MGKSEDIQTLGWLFQKSGGQRFRILLLMLGNGLFAASAIWFALICRQLIDCAVGQDGRGALLQACSLLGVVLLQMALRIFCNSMLEYVRSRLDISMKQSILEVLLKKDYQEVSRYHSGELLNRLFSDIQIITDGVTGILPNLVNMVTRLLMAVGVMIAMDPAFTLVFLIAGAAIFLVTRLFRGKMKAMHKEVQRREGLVRSFLQELLESLLIVKVFGIEQQMKDKTALRQEDYFRAQMKRRTFAITANAGIQFVFRLGYLYAMCWGAFGLYHQTLSYGSMTAVLQMVGQIQAPFSSLSGLMPRIYSMLASAERLIELENMREEPLREPLDPLETYQKLKTIEFRDVSFSYGRTPVIRDTGFLIEKGDFAAITGLSGGGKSTMFLLLLGAYRLEKGTIALNISENGRVRPFKPGASLRRMFAYVPQGNYLFSGTVRENVTMLKPDASDEEIWRALSVSCANAFVEELPDRLDTQVGEHGFGFSEGQVQRIAIARAILGGAPILLLDEATSALDEPTEAQLLKNLASMKEKTCLIVTHRKAALSICNRILQVEDGIIKETGRE